MLSSDGTQLGLQHLCQKGARHTAQPQVPHYCDFQTQPWQPAPQHISIAQHIAAVQFQQRQPPGMLFGPPFVVSRTQQLCYNPQSAVQYHCQQAEPHAFAHSFSRVPVLATCGDPTCYQPVWSPLPFPVPTPCPKRPFPAPALRSTTCESVVNTRSAPESRPLDNKMLTGEHMKEEGLTHPKKRRIHACDHGDAKEVYSKREEYAEDRRGDEETSGHDLENKGKKAEVSESEKVEKVEKENAEAGECEEEEEEDREDQGQESMEEEDFDGSCEQPPPSPASPEPHCCPSCGRLFAKSGNLLRHIQRKHAGLACVHPALYASELSEKPALRKHDEDRGNESASREGERSSPSLSGSSLPLLSSSHSPTRKPFPAPPMLSCPHRRCSKLFATKRELKQHLISHPRVGQFVCPHCGRQFGRSFNLTRHVRSQHGGARQAMMDLLTAAQREVDDQEKGGERKGKTEQEEEENQREEEEEAVEAGGEGEEEEEKGVDEERVSVKEGEEAMEDDRDEEEEPTRKRGRGADVRASEGKEGKQRPKERRYSFEEVSKQTVGGAERQSAGRAS